MGDADEDRMTYHNNQSLFPRPGIRSWFISEMSSGIKEGLGTPGWLNEQASGHGREFRRVEALSLAFLGQCD